MINVQNRSSNIQIPTASLEPQISQVPTTKIFTTATDEPRERERGPQVRSAGGTGACGGEGEPRTRQ